MSRQAVLKAWNPAWQEYLQIFESDKKNFVQKVVNIAKGRNKTDNNDDQIRITGAAFAKGLAKTQNANDAEHCVKALHVFIQFIVHNDNNKIRGWDGYFKHIFSASHPAFKKKWMAALDEMVAYIEGLYPTPPFDPVALERFNKFIRENGTNWKRIKGNIRRAQEQIQVEELKMAMPAPRHATLTVRKSSNQALTEPHTLERMRGLLCEI